MNDERRDVAIAAQRLSLAAGLLARSDILVASNGFDDLSIRNEIWVVNMRNARRRVSVERLEERKLMASGAGVTAQYFSDTELTSLVTTRIENGLVQNWGNGAPVAGLNADQFSARFVGQFEAKYTELHTFTLAAEGGARLWINGVKVIDRWADSSFPVTATDVSLIAGRKYDIQLEFRENGGLASLNLQWSSPSMPAQPIAVGSLFPSERGSVERRVWNSVPGSTVASLTSLPTFPNQPSISTALTSLETSSTGLDQYGQLLVGKLYPTKTGQYRFYIAGDDSAEFWLSNSASPSGKQKIAFVSTATAPRNWTASTSQQSAILSLVAGQAYAFEVIHKENNGSDHVAVGWKQPGSSSIEVIDGQFLAPPLPTVRVFSKRADAIEGDVNPIEFVVQRSGSTLTNPLTVSYSLGGSATSGIDYSPKSGSVTIPAGSAIASVLIATLSDSLFESSESVQMELIDGAGYEVGLISERQSVGTIQNVGNIVPGGTVISPAMVLGNYQAFGGTFAQIAPVAPFSGILQATVTTVPPNLFNAQLRLAFTGTIQQGDVLWAEFYVRSIGGTGKITVLSEKNTDPFTKSLFQGLSITTDWARVQLPFVAQESYAPGAATFGFYLGAQVQTLQFADISVRNYGRNREITPAALNLNEIGGKWGFESNVAVSGQAFSSATQITTTALPTNSDSWRLQYGGTNSASVRSGDIVQLEFYARGVSGSSPRVAVAVQQASGNFDTYTFQTINLSGTWQRYVVNTLLPADFATGGLQAMLNVGFSPQAVQFAAIKWTNLSAIVNFSELPSLVPGSTTYGGRDSQDGWRSDADQRIADVRQSTLTVNVVDSNGNPVDGAVVSVRQSKQSFLFGSAIDGGNNLLSSTGGSDALKYQSEIKRLFNAVTIENSLKWPSFLQNRQQGIDVANWVTSNALYLRGHNVIWPSERNMPSNIWPTYRSKLAAEGAVAAATYLRETIQTRIQDAVGTFANQAAEWDIVNEPYDNNEAMRVLGNQVLVDWFLQARQVDPDVARVLNDYDIFARNGNNTAHRTNFDSWLTLLKANSAIERIGEQSHYNESNLTDIAVLGQLIQSYHTQFGLPIAITEFDVESTNVQLQADYLRDYMTMLFSQSGVDEFIQWGFWNKAHWKPNSALFNADFSIRPNGQVYEDLVFGNWWTDTRGTTRNGAFVSDVFEGDYTITVSIGEQVITRTLQGFKADNAISIALPGVVWSSTQLTGIEGSPSTITAVLSKAPTANVVITLPTNSQISVSPAQLTFTPSNWNVAQTITVTPIEDFIAEGTQTAAINASLSSADRSFSNAVTTPVTIRFTDRSAILADSPTGYWRLGEASGTVATDASVNGRHGTYENGVVYGVAGAVSGDPNTAIQFGAANARVRIPDNALLRPSTLSLEGIVKVQGAEIWDTVLSKTSPGWNDGYGIYYHPANGGELRFFINGYTNYVAAPFSSNQYVHVAATYDGSAMKLYYDGVQVASKAFNAAIIHSVDPLYLGWAPGTPTYSFNGTLDEAAVYGTALSAAQILKHSQALQSSDSTPPSTLSFARSNPTTATTSADSLVFLATFSEPVTNVDVLDFAVNSTSTATVTNVAQVGTSNSYEVTISGGNLASFNGTVGLNLSAANNIRDLAGLALLATEPPIDESYTVSNSTGYDGVVLADSPAGYWRLGEASGAVATDSSVNGLHGTYENGVVYGVPGPVLGSANTAIQFGSPNARVAIANNALLRPSSISVEAFVNVQGATTWDTVIAKTSSGWSDGYGIYYHQDNGGELRFFVNGFTNYVAAPIPSNRYVHVAATYDGSTMRLYYDGVPVGTPKAFSAAINHSAQLLQIGWAPDVGSYSFNGRIDEVAIFGRALTPAQVQTHYNASSSYQGLVLSDSPTGYWRLGESSGNVAADASPNAQHGTYENGVVYGVPGAVLGDPNTAIQFGAANSRVRIPDNALLRPSSLSLEGIVKVQGAEIWDTVIAKTTTGWNDGYGIYYHPANGGELRFFINGYTNYVAAPIVSNQYVHVAATYDGTAMRLYYGGVQVASQALNAVIVHSSDLLYVGWAPGSATYSFNGTIDEVAMYGRALSAATIQLHYARSAAQISGLSGTIASTNDGDGFQIASLAAGSLEISMAKLTGLNGVARLFNSSETDVGDHLSASSEGFNQRLMFNDLIAEANFVSGTRGNLNNVLPRARPYRLRTTSTPRTNLDDLASGVDEVFGLEVEDLFDGWL